MATPVPSPLRRGGVTRRLTPTMPCGRQGTTAPRRVCGEACPPSRHCGSPRQYGGAPAPHYDSQQAVRDCPAARPAAALPAGLRFASAPAPRGSFPPLAGGVPCSVERWSEGAPLFCLRGWLRCVKCRSRGGLWVPACSARRHNKHGGVRGAVAVGAGPAPGAGSER